MAKSFAQAMDEGPAQVSDIPAEDMGDPSDTALAELAVNQCLRVLRRHGVTGAVVAAQGTAVHRGAVIGQSENLFEAEAAVPEHPAAVVQLCSEIRNVVAELKNVATAFRDTLECCRIAWEEKQNGAKH